MRLDRKVPEGLSRMRLRVGQKEVVWNERPGNVVEFGRGWGTVVGLATGKDRG
jgi:hypothetical protein